MAQACSSSEVSISLTTADGVLWTKIIGGVIGMISLVLQDHGDQYLIDRITIVRGFAELSLMYPNNPAYRQRMTTALLTLSETLSDRGDSMSAAQVKSLSDRCRKFDKSMFGNDGDLTIQPPSAEAAARFAANKA